MEAPLGSLRLRSPERAPALSRRCAALLALAAALLALSAARADAPSSAADRTAAEDATPVEARTILARAFARMLNYPSVRSVTLRVHRGGARVSLRAFDTVYQIVDGRGHLLLRFTAPEYLRHSALLVIEQPGQASATWLYQPELRRSRRVGTSQRADAFYGSDLTIEDLEHQDWRYWDARFVEAEPIEGCRCRTIEGVPRIESQYTRIVVWVDPDLAGFRRVDFFRSRDATPLKSLLVDMDDLVVDGDIVKPRRMTMRQHGRDAYTEILFDRIETDTVITDRIFSAMRLEQSGQDLYDIVERAGKEEPRGAELP